MKNIISVLILTVAIASSSLASASSKVFIECGDVNKAYVEMDLSKDFLDTYFNNKSQRDFENLGYDYAIAGRNCGLNSWQSNQEFEVLFLFEGKRFLKELIDFGPMTIRPATLKMRVNSIEDLESGVVFVGDEKENLQEVNGNSIASLELERGKGKVVVIVRRR